MIPIRLTLTNFISYRSSQILDFTPFDLAVLSGSNGVGKSSLLEAITWCLWEKSRTGSSDDLINQGQQGMWVEFVFEHEGGIYRVLRKREKRARAGATVLEFQVAQAKLHDLVQWDSLTEATIRQTQEKIINALKVSYDLFVNSSFLRQGNADEFTVKLPSERKEILAEILGLSIYDQLAEKAKEQKKQTQARLEVLILQSQELSKEVEDRRKFDDELNVTQVKKDKLAKTAEHLEKQHKTFLQQSKQYELIEQQLKMARDNFNEKKDMIIQNQLEFEKISQEVFKLETLLQKSSQIKKDYVDYQKFQSQLEQYNHKIAQLSELREALSVLEHKKATVNQTVTRIKSIKNCPTCLRPMTTKESAKVIDALVRVFEETDAPNLNKLKIQIDKIGYNRQKHETLRQKVSDNDEVVEKYQQLLVAENSKKEKQNQVSKIENYLSQAKNEIKKIIEQGTKIKRESENLQTSYQKTQEAEIKLAQVRDGQNQLEGRLGELRAKIQQIVETTEKLKKWQKEIVELQEQLSIWEELALAFSKKGIQTMIIEQTLPAIEEKANELLKRITDGRMTVQFITQKAKKTAVEELIETLEIVISDEMGSRAYEMFSGGESFRINFAIRVGLAKLLAVRSGAKLQFLVIDEGFGALDTAGRDDIVVAINSIRDDFKKILVVSHVPEMKDAFQSRVEVTKDAAGSHINILT